MLYNYSDDLIYPTLKGDMVRSKGELAIANTLFNLGLEYKYESPMKFGDDLCHPDFTVMFGKRVFIWEHIGAGMLKEPGYLEKLLFKLYYYRCLSTFKYSIIVTTPNDSPERIIKQVIISPNPPIEYNLESRLQDIPNEEEDWPLPSIDPSNLPKILKNALTPAEIREQYIREARLQYHQNIQLLIVEVGGVRLIRKSRLTKSWENTLRLDISESQIVERRKNHQLTYIAISELYVIEEKGNLQFKRLSPEDSLSRIWLYSSKRRDETTNPAVAQYLKENNREDDYSVFNNLKEVLFLYKDVKPQLHILLELTEEKSQQEILTNHIRGEEAKPKSKVKTYKFDIVVPSSPCYINEVNRNIESVMEQREAWEREEARKLEEQEQINRERQIAVLKAIAAQNSIKQTPNQEKTKPNNAKFKPQNKKEHRKK